MSSACANPFHILNTLPGDQVRRLACGASNLASKNLVVIPIGSRIRFWRRTKVALTGCKECKHTWRRGNTPEHSADCVTGRVHAEALAIIALGDGPLPLHLRRVDPADHPLRRRDDIQLVPTPTHTERSFVDNGSTETSRTAATPSGSVLSHGPDYGEEWAWDPQRRQVVDRQGFVVADMLDGTDLTTKDQDRFGERIALCVNFLRGISNEWLRDAIARVRISMRAPMEPEEQDGIVLECDLAGWYVEVNGARVTFDGVTERDRYVKAKAYFDARVAASRRGCEVLQ